MTTETTLDHAVEQLGEPGDIQEARAAAGAVLRDGVVKELMPVMEAIRVLVDSLRVLGEVEFLADSEPDFGQRLTRKCPTWRTPLCEPREEMLYSLCWLMRSRAEELVRAFD